MNLSTWSKDNVQYGKKLVSSGLVGARSAREQFFHDKPTRRVLDESIQRALKPAVIGACIGIVGSYPGNRNRSAGRVLVFAGLGAAIGFAAGLGWQNRDLTACVASAALKNMGKARDEHWLEKHPIDYA